MAPQQAAYGAAAVDHVHQHLAPSLQAPAQNAIAIRVDYQDGSAGQPSLASDPYCAEAPSLKISILSTDA